MKRGGWELGRASCLDFFVSLAFLPVSTAAVDTVHHELPALIFDVGGVVVDCHRVYLFDRLISDPNRRRFFLDEVCPGWCNEEIDGGKPMSLAVEERVREYPA
ncbi:hypothetical protein [Saccharopolyspora sp. 5N708]|uniref:hypothetical protein n=1 Tax=Saccharopolyspora sp. 5N708 TaxID=3457424 RepID=UPI003FD524E3